MKIKNLLKEERKETKSFKIEYFNYMGDIVPSADGWLHPWIQAYTREEAEAAAMKEMRAYNRIFTSGPNHVDHVVVTNII